MSDSVCLLRYRELRPHPALARYVECFWVLEGNPPPAGLAPEAILPDGCLELILNFAAPFRRQSEPGVMVPQPLRMLVGQMGRPAWIQPTGRVELLGIRFHPAGAYPFLRSPIHEFTGRMCGLDEVCRSLDDLVSTGVEEQRSTTRKVSALEEILRQRLSEFAGPEAGVEAAVGTILRREGAVRMEELAEGLGISRRQLERKFLQWVGLPPKRLARIVRFQRVFRALERDQANWAGVAAACGYYDSAHLIKDFREFSGQTPTRLLEQETLLTQLFTRKNRLSLSYNTSV